MRDLLVPLVWLVIVGGLVIWIADGFIGWRPRFGLEAEFQKIIAEADVAERFGGSRGHQNDDVTEPVCSRVDAETLGRLGIPVDDRTHWPAEMGGEAKPDIWKVRQDKGWIRACQDGIRHLEISIDRVTGTCRAEVKLWHAGCAL